MAVIFHTLDTFDTEYSADSVEWCPVEPLRDLIVCGTYQLSENEENATKRNGETSKRLGRIYAFRATDGDGLSTLQRIDVPAVLDMKWMHAADGANRALLAVVNSVGYLQIYRLAEDEQSETKLELIAERRVSDDDEESVLALSLDWSTGRCIDNPRIVVSDSRGRVSRFTLRDSDLTKDLSWQAHDFEAWITGFDYWKTHCFYSGGDDCKFQAFDDRAGPDPVACSRAHGAGVTSFHSNANREYIFATGSYDEILRLWDNRWLKRPTSETNLGGGIWRLKWDPFRCRYLLAACMYNGFKIVDCGDGNSVPLIVGEYDEHRSISYGCDWSFLTRKDVSRLNVRVESRRIGALVSTCSFYDHAFKLSAVCFADGDWPDS